MLIERSSSANLFLKQKLNLSSLIDNIKNNQKIPSLHSAIINQTIKPYGLTDITTTAN